MQKTQIPEILDKIREKINLPGLLTKIPQERNKLIAIIAVTILLLCLDLSFALRSQMRAIGALSPKIARLKEDIRNLKSDLVKIEKQDVDMLAADEGRIKKLIFFDQTSWLIEEISRLANQEEVRILQINPAREKSQEKSLFILINLELYAGYHQLGRLLAELENYPILLQIEELDIEQSKDPFKQDINLTLKAYLSS